MTGAGDLRERFAFDKRILSSDGAGNQQGVWEEQFILSVQRGFLRGGESVQAARLEGRAPALLTIWSSGLSRSITTDWRCRDTRSDDVFNIRAVTPRQTNDFIDLLVEKGVADG